MSFELTSRAFVNGQAIPKQYTCVGRNVSPPLTWTHPPEGTKSFVLIVDDPDAPMGTWVHWIVFNIPAEISDLEEDLTIMNKRIDPNAIHVGKNSYGSMRYQGPCPPNGTHRYFFKLYAIDILLPLLSSPFKSQLLEAINGHVLAHAELMGIFHK